MIILKCDKCGVEYGWYNAEHLPAGWEEVEGLDLCVSCATEYKGFKEALDREVKTKIDSYFGKGESNDKS